MYRFQEKRWDSKRMLGSGGMPSSHSATVTVWVCTTTSSAKRDKSTKSKKL
ncbi:hypothetical protein Dimus_014062 [Dionaea muscipula]